MALGKLKYYSNFLPLSDLALSLFAHTSTHVHFVCFAAFVLYPPKVVSRLQIHQATLGLLST